MTGGKIMKTKAILYSALALLAIACTKETLVENNENNENNQDQNSKVTYIPMELSAMTEGSKTVLGEISAEGIAVNWLSADQISIFDNAEGANNQFTIKSLENGNAVFSGEVPADATEFYALYPHRNSKFDKVNKVISSYLDPNQPAKPGSFATTYAHMAGVLQDNTIEFKNLFNHIQFTIADDITDVKSITLMGNKGETLAGSYDVSFKTGEPVLKATSPEIYVTLKSSGEEALKPGVYYFSIFPTNFESGFTVILSKTDGTQKAISKNTAINLSQRNTILLTKTAESTKYTDHLNYFVKYNDGFDIAVGDPEKGGYKFNKTTHPGGKMMHDGRSNTKIEEDGVYFIDNKSNNIKINYNDLDNLIICAVNSGTKAIISNGRALRPKTNENGVLLLKNLSMTSESLDVVQQQSTNNNGVPGTSFGYIVFDDCQIKGLARHLIYFGNAATSVKTIAITNCDISNNPGSKSDNSGKPYTTFHCVNFGVHNSKLENLYIYNNVFYKIGTTDNTDFKVLNATSKNSQINKIQVTNNTVDSLKIVNAGMIVSGKLSSCTITKNLFNRNTLTNSHGNLAGVPLTTPSADNPLQVTIIQNYFYTKTQKNITVPKNIRPSETNNISGSVGSPVSLSISPLSNTWDPANGTYGSYTITPTDGAAPTQQMGAVRWDTVPEANTAAYRYAPNELGSF